MAELRSDIRQIGDKARELGKLVDHPAWAILRAEFDGLKETYFKRLATRLVSGGLKAEALDQRELDYQRGFFRGAEWILANPEMIAKTLEKALERENSG